MLTIREIIELLIKVSLTSVCAFLVMGVACVCTYALFQVDMLLFPDSWPVFMDATWVQSIVLAVTAVHGIVFLFFSMGMDLRSTMRDHEQRMRTMRAEQQPTDPVEVQ